MSTEPAAPGTGTDERASREALRDRGSVDHHESRNRLSGDQVLSGGGPRLLAIMLPLVVAFLGAHGPVGRVLDEGLGSRNKALALAGCAVLWAAFLTLRNRLPAWAWVLTTAALGTASWALVLSATGRAPVLLTIWGVCCAQLAISPRRGPSCAWTGLASLLVAQGLWRWNGANLQALATYATSTILVLRRPPALAQVIEPLDSKVARLVSTTIEVGWSRALQFGQTIAGSASTCRSAAQRSFRTHIRPGGSLGVVKRRPWISVGVTVIVAALMVPALMELTSGRSSYFGVSDHQIHLELARELRAWPPFLAVPHPVYHALVRLLDPLVGETFAPVLLLAVATGVGTVLLARWWEIEDGAKRRLTASVGLPLAVVFTLAESPAVLLQAMGLVEPGTPFVPLHAFGNPTDTFVLPMLFVLVPTIVGVAASESAITVRRGATLAALVTVATAAKPSFTLALLPALPLWVWRQGMWNPGRTRRLATWVLLPGVAVVLAQTYLQVSGHSPRVSNGFTIDPLALVDVYGWTTGGWSYWVIVTLPLMAIIVGGRRFTGERTTALLLWSLLVSLVPLLLLRETGSRAYDGNLGKSGFFCWFLLATWSIRFLALETIGLIDRRRRGAQKRLPWWVWGEGALLIGSVLGGVLAYLDIVGIANVGLTGK